MKSSEKSFCSFFLNVLNFAIQLPLKQNSWSCILVWLLCNDFVFAKRRRVRLARCPSGFRGGGMQSSVQCIGGRTVGNVFTTEMSDLGTGSSNCFHISLLRTSSKEQASVLGDN